jgi:hypothetical protein
LSIEPSKIGSKLRDIASHQCWFIIYGGHAHETAQTSPFSIVMLMSSL